MDRDIDYKPTLHVSDKDLPEIKKWKVGEEYEIIIKVTQKSASVIELPNGEQQVNASFEVTDMVIPDDSDVDVDDMDDEEFSKYASKKKREDY